MATMRAAAAAEETFQSRLNANEPFEQVQLVELVRALAVPLGEAHRAGRYHGSISPVDIRFNAAGQPSLGGWGRDTAPNAMQSSPYAPIETYAPVHPQGPWTDVYALAAILWRAVTGGPPASVLHRKGHVTLERMAPSQYTPAFLRAIDAALEIAPQRRPRDIDSWFALLSGEPARAAAARAPVMAAPRGEAAASPEAPARTPAPAPRRSWSGAALAAGIAAAVIGGVYLGTSTPTGAPVEPRRVAAAAPAPAAAPVRPVAPVVTATAGAAAPAAPEPAVDLAVVAPAPAPVRAAAEPPAEAAAPKPAPARRAAPAPASRPKSPPAEVAPAPAPAPAEGGPPLALLAQADDRLRDIFRDYEKLSSRLRRSYRDDDLPYAVKQQAYRESQRIQAALSELREDRNRILAARRPETANRRYAELAEDATRLRDRIEMVRRSL